MVRLRVARVQPYAAKIGYEYRRLIRILLYEEIRHLPFAVQGKEYFHHETHHKGGQAEPKSPILSVELSSAEPLRKEVTLSFMLR